MPDLWDIAFTYFTIVFAFAELHCSMNECEFWNPYLVIYRYIYRASYFGIWASVRITSSRYRSVLCVIISYMIYIKVSEGLYSSAMLDVSLILATITSDIQHYDHIIPYFNKVIPIWVLSFICNPGFFQANKNSFYYTSCATNAYALIPWIIYACVHVQSHCDRALIFLVGSVAIGLAVMRYMTDANHVCELGTDFAAAIIAAVLSTTKF